ncbi:hypothetical protein V6N13_064876 [Hibiscus sabdariffa]|uniref:Secreted protein n=1 Tax=Hibiscus sabdariffa TaxID=183260 RepID=A0ABR2ED68_9ROSI
MGKSLLAKVLAWRLISICFVAETSTRHLKNANRATVDSISLQARRSSSRHHGRGMDEYGHGRVASLTRIGNRLVKPTNVMEGYNAMD